MDAEHSLGCSWATDQICTCHHIAALEEEASWVRPEFPGAPDPSSYVHFSTSRGIPVTGTFIGTSSFGYSPAADKAMYDIKSKAEYEAEKRAEIYAKSDALRAKKGFPY